MGLKMQKRLIKAAKPDKKVIESPTIECPVIDCDSDVVDLSLDTETESYVIWAGVCRLCDHTFVLKMDK